jgi:hypothetical protein
LGQIENKLLILLGLGRRSVPHRRKRRGGAGIPVGVLVVGEPSEGVAKVVAACRGRRRHERKAKSERGREKRKRTGGENGREYGTDPFSTFVLDATKRRGRRPNNISSWNPRTGTETGIYYLTYFCGTPFSGGSTRINKFYCSKMDFVGLLLMRILFLINKLSHIIYFFNMIKNL